MKTYTKEERLEIYKKALIILKKRWHTCLCGAIYTAINDDSNFPSEVPLHFEEILAIKPPDASVGHYWWPFEDVEIRIEKLTQIIKSLEDANS